MCLQAVFFTCFLIGALAAFRINYWLYLVLAYGWVNVRKLNLHFTSYRPPVISNGDKVSQLGDFGIFVASLILAFAIFGMLISFIERLTRRLGREIDIIKTMDVLAKEDYGSLVFGIIAMAIAVATAFVTVYASFLHALSNCVIFVVVTSIVLRVVLRNVGACPLPPAKRSPEQKS